MVIPAGKEAAEPAGPKDDVDGGSRTATRKGEENTAALRSISHAAGNRMAAATAAAPFVHPGMGTRPSPLSSHLPSSQSSRKVVSTVPVVYQVEWYCTVVVLCLHAPRPKQHIPALPGPLARTDRFLRSRLRILAHAATRGLRQAGRKASQSPQQPLFARRRRLRPMAKMARIVPCAVGAGHSAAPRANKP